MDRGRYTDKNGETFYVCYTQDQIDAQVSKWGFFSPYIPLMVTGNVTED